MGESTRRPVGTSPPRSIVRAAAGLGLLLTAAGWAVPARADSESYTQSGEYVKAARYPAQFATASFVKAFGPASTRPTIDVHSSVRVVAASELTERLTLGASALWFQSRAAWVEGDDTDWLHGLLGGPVLSYTAQRWCLAAMALVGATGEHWSRRTLGVFPLLTGCWAPGPNGMLQLGAAGFVGPEGFRAYPVVGGRYGAGAHDLRVLLPFWAKYTYWVNNDFGFGASLLGNPTPYVTPGNVIGEQLGLVFPVFGASVSAQLSARVGISLVVGAALSPVVFARDREIHGGHRIVPALGLTLDLDQRLTE